jgi:hypothetical protein
LGSNVGLLNKIINLVLLQQLRNCEHLKAIPKQSSSCRIHNLCFKISFYLSIYLYLSIYKFIYLPIYLYIYLPIHPSMVLQPLWIFAAFLQILNAYADGRTPWTVDQPIARPLPTHRTTQTQNKGIQTSMLRVGFEPMSPEFRQTKTVHALDGVLSVIIFIHSSSVLNYSTT